MWAAGSSRTTPTATDTGCFGRFGSLGYIDQPRAEAPKYDAIQRWLEGR